MQMFYVWGVILYLDKYIFPLQTCFTWGDHLSLQSSWIQVNMVYTQKYKHGYGLICQRHTNNQITVNINRSQTHMFHFNEERNPK